ncbi:MAG: SGNH/GDSL hydrolase family protein [Tannerella sp.]|jgi:hypothetical protein|nr:SGNH/GDSL hydrolase family protein [Tannerella sp.]
MKNKKHILAIAMIIAGVFRLHAATVPTTVLYHKILNNKDTYPELRIDKNTKAGYTPGGLEITGKGGLVQLDKYYSLGERMIRYHVRFSQDAVAVFQSNTGDFKVSVNMIDKTVSVATHPESWKKMDFLDPENEYIVEIYRLYQKNTIRIIDLFTGEADQIELVTDGTGGCGIGAVSSGFHAGGQHDYYCFGLQSGTSVLIKQISVMAGACDLLLLIYGASISEPEGYFPTKDFPEAWTQLIQKNIKGEAISSGRGGCQIAEVLERIKNELPYVKAKYVMVTIGTNGGNTEENLSELVEYILGQGSIPILNNIPCNESGTQVEVNRVIEKVRRKYNINGCRFDLATSVKHDGKEVDKTTMYHEDYTGSYGWQIYHHPNVKGSRRMYLRTLIDIPEIYE